MVVAVMSNVTPLDRKGLAVEGENHHTAAVLLVSFGLGSLGSVDNLRAPSATCFTVRLAYRGSTFADL
jgi:hypothetical protein